MKEKKIFDLDHRTKNENFFENDMILLHNIKRKTFTQKNLNTGNLTYI